MNDLTYEEILLRYEEALMDLEFARFEIRQLRQSESDWMDFADELMERLSEAGLL